MLVVLNIFIRKRTKETKSTDERSDFSNRQAYKP